MRCTDVRSKAFLIFSTCHFVAGVFLCLKHRVKQDAQNIVLVHCIEIFFGHFNAPDWLSGFLVASIASTGFREKCIPDSVRCLERMLIHMSCIT